MVGAFNDPAGVETAQTLEAALREVDLELGIVPHRPLDVGDELRVGVAHQARHPVVHVNGRNRRQIDELHLRVLPREADEDSER